MIPAMPHNRASSGVMGAVNLTISSDQTTYDLFVAAGSPTGAVVLTVTVAAGVYVGSFTNVGAWAAGTTHKLVNNSYVVGVGGAGNSGAGGDAITLGWPISIDNTNGVIGGGGGGGQRGKTGSGGTQGGGGGGGRGLPGGAAGAKTGAGGGAADGTAGTKSARGTGGSRGSSGANHGGTGGNGGNLGFDGEQSGTNDAGARTGSPGAAGKAIDLNGYAVTWLGGFNASQVKGAVS